MEKEYRTLLVKMPHTKTSTYSLEVNRKKLRCPHRSYLLQYSPQKERRQNGREEPYNLGSFGQISTRQIGETNRFFVLFMGGEGFGAGGRGLLGGLPHIRGKAGDTFSLEKTGFSLSTETLSSLEPIWSLNISLSCQPLCMVLDTIGREAEKKHLPEQIETQSLIKPWVDVCWEQDECGEEQVRRI